MLADYRKIDNTLYINADYHHEKVLELETKILKLRSEIQAKPPFPCNNKFQQYNIDFKQMESNWQKRSNNKKQT